jgi:hypothetical protein
MAVLGRGVWGGMAGGRTAARRTIVRKAQWEMSKGHEEGIEDREALTSHHCRCHYHESHLWCCLCRDQNSGLLRPKRSWMADLGQPLFVCSDRCVVSRRGRSGSSLTMDDFGRRCWGERG